MRPNRRTTPALALAALLGLATVGAAPVAARPDGFSPTPPSTPSPLLYTIHDTEVVEGDGTGQVLAFEITATKPIVADSSMRVHTGNLGFEATPGIDFTPIDEIVVMPAGATSVVVEVPVHGDLELEDDELVVAWLSDPTYGAVALSGGTALGRILDDDTPTIHISQESHVEGSGGGFTPFVFTISLSKPVDHDVSVNVLTTPGTAQFGPDIFAPATTVTIPAGEVLRTYTVSVVADDFVEADEEFVVELSGAVGGTIVGGGGLGRILDDDAPGRFTGPGSLKAERKALGQTVGSSVLR